MKTPGLVLPWGRCSENVGGFPNTTGLKSICFHSEGKKDKSLLEGNEVYSRAGTLKNGTRRPHIPLPNNILGNWGIRKTSMEGQEEQQSKDMKSTCGLSKSQISFPVTRIPQLVTSEAGYKHTTLL